MVTTPRLLMIFACLALAGTALGQQQILPGGCVTPPIQPQVPTFSRHPFTQNGSGFAGIGQIRSKAPRFSGTPRYSSVVYPIPVVVPSRYCPPVYSYPQQCDPPVIIQPYPRYGYGYGYGGYGYGSPRQTTYIVNQGASLIVNGRYADDRLKVGVGLNSGSTTSRRSFDNRSYAGDDSIVVIRDGGGLGNNAIDARPYRQAPRTGVNDARATQPDGAMGGMGRDAADDRVPEPPTSLELGTLLLRAERPDEAAVELRKHLKDQPGDTEAMRTLAIALMEDRQLDDAAGVMRLAYRTDPKLGQDPMSARNLGYTAREFRELVTQMVEHAHRTESASAWMTVAALMQTEGRDELAKAMLERAMASGLEAEIADSLRLGLKQ